MVFSRNSLHNEITYATFRGMKLKQLMDEQGFTCERLARRLDVSHQTVSAWRTGYRMPRPKKLKELARIFGVSMEELV